MRVSFRAIAVVCLLLSSMSALASLTDDVAIVNHCGAPLSQDQQVSPATNQYTENLFYPDNIVMHFLPASGGWQLTSGWMRHIPVTRDGLAARMPCVMDALNEVASTSKTAVEPLEGQQTLEHASQRGFGIPFLWLIFALIVTLIVFLLWPSKREVPSRPIARAPQRLPEVVVQEQIRRSTASHKVAK